MGTFHNSRLVAALIVYLAGESFLMLYQKSLTAHLRFGVNNALGFTFTQKALSRPGVKKLFYGFECLDAPERVDEFKFRMGYIAKPVRQRVIFHPALRPLVKPVTLVVLNHLGGKILRSPRWLKAAGMLRFCLEGNRTISQEAWPYCLLDQREELLGRSS